MTSRSRNTQKRLRGPRPLTVFNPSLTPMDEEFETHALRRPTHVRPYAYGSDPSYSRTSSYSSSDFDDARSTWSSSSSESTITSTSSSSSSRRRDEHREKPRGPRPLTPLGSRHKSRSNLPPLFTSFPPSYEYAILTRERTSSPLPAMSPTACSSPWDMPGMDFPVTPSEEDVIDWDRIEHFMECWDGDASNVTIVDGAAADLNAHWPHPHESLHTKR